MCGGGGRGLEVILVRMRGPDDQNPPYSYPRGYSDIFIHM